jgi:hypothetical protein
MVRAFITASSSSDDDDVYTDDDDYSPYYSYDCAVSDWSSYSACSSSCGFYGTQTHTRTIVRQPYYGKSCPRLSHSRSCNRFYCPIDCWMSTWSAYSPCTVSCGGGSQTQSRTVITQPSYGGAACPALTNVRSCNSYACPIDCVVSAWGDFSQCSLSCGGGVQTRSRSVLTAPTNGTACPALNNTQTCNGQPCPVDCLMSNWVTVGSCSKTCGTGIATHTRTVTTSALNGGVACPIDTNRTTTCLVEACDACLSNPCIHGRCSRACL